MASSSLNDYLAKNVRQNVKFQTDVDDEETANFATSLHPFLKPEEKSAEDEEERNQSSSSDEHYSTIASSQSPATVATDETARIMDTKYLKSDESGGGLYFGNYTRYVVLVVSTVCLSFIMCNSLALNFTIICMTPDEVVVDSVKVVIMNNVSSSLSQNDGSESSVNDEPFRGQSVSNSNAQYYFTNAQKSALFSAIAVGTLIGTLPITYFTAKYGVRRTFTGYGAVSAISTLLTPLCAFFGFVPLLSMRFFQGIALATSFPAMGSIVSQWSTLKNSGMYIALLSCHLQFGQIFTMPVSGELCTSRWGWPAVYYLQGTLTILSFVVFYMFFRDSPQVHRNVSTSELSKIQKGKDFELENIKMKVPYRAIARDPSVWGIFATNIGGNLGFQIFMQYGPIYLNKALKFDVKNTGFAAALPYVLSALMKFFVGPFSDYFTFVSVKTRIIIFATASQFLMAFCFVALAFLPPDYPTLIQACFTMSTVFSGLNCVGVAKSTQLISRQFAHVLMALGAIVASCVVLVIPLVVALFVPNNTTDEWARIFIFIAVVVIVTTVIFDITAEADPRPWTYAASAKSSSTSIVKRAELSAANVLATNAGVAKEKNGGSGPGHKVFSIDVESLESSITKSSSSHKDSQ